MPALFGSFLIPAIYKLLLQLKMNRWIAAMGGLLIVFDNALLTQSRFILMEPMLILFSTAALLFLLKFLEAKVLALDWWIYGIISAACYAFSVRLVPIINITNIRKITRNSKNLANMFFNCFTCKQAENVVYLSNHWRLLPTSKFVRTSHK